jgi:hypothetical protein
MIQYQTHPSRESGPLYSSSQVAQHCEQSTIPLVSVFLNSLWKGEGKLTAIKDYCQQTIDQELNECIWLCMRRGGGTIAEDVQLSQHSAALGIDDLRKQ